MCLKQAIIKFSKVLLALCVIGSAYAQHNDSLSIIFNQYQFVQGENIIIEATIENFDSAKASPQTLHLWIDNIANGKRQKFRYPMLSGYLKLALKVDSTITDGKYAFNFLLGKQFFAINGKIERGMSDNKTINYVVTAKNKAPIVNDIAVYADSTFTVQNFYFEDTVLFGFSPKTKTKENNLRININTPLDSLFKPIVKINEIITIGKNINEENNTNPSETYSFVQYKVDKKTLQEITVIGKKKTEGEKFDEENSRGIFAMGDAKVIDFLSSEDHLAYSDLYSYLQATLPGIQAVTNNNNGQPLLRWRNETTDIYVDEVFDEDFNANNISMQDIAIIKVYRQGFRLQGGSLGDGLGGTIAIYTKRRNDYNANRLTNYTFYIKGYNQIYTQWKIN
ncbi:MAG: hypothetical protein KA319_02810 [Ferruginibacter sp.]|nr:hypothetical protein [Ferruginibacter sp.]